MLQLRPKTVLSDTYELLDLLGQGGMGEVWRAQHLRIPKQVAVKVLAAAVQQNSEAVARFRREAEITSRLGHPNIVEILDFNVLADGRSYLAMELLHGEDLRQALARGLLPLEEALRLLRQVASALTVAHQAGVIHRDLKPENIFLARARALPDEPPTAKILDFGISKMQGEQTMITAAHAVIGTPAYMSPEQASGKNDLIDARTDQFSLAAIAYEMFSGSCPFAGATLTEVIYKVVFENPPSLSAVRPSLPGPLIKVVERAMSKQPQTRFSDVKSFMRALEGSADSSAMVDTQLKTGSAPGAALAATQMGANPTLGAAATLLGQGPKEGQGLEPTLLGQTSDVVLGTEAAQLGKQGSTQLAELQQGAAEAEAISAKTPPAPLWRGRGLLGGVVLLLVVAAGAALMLTRERPVRRQLVPAAYDAGGRAPGAPPTPDLGQPALAADSAAVVSAEGAPDAGRAALDQRRTGLRRQPPVQQPQEQLLLPEARERLRLARDALRQGDYETAILKARQSMLSGEHSAAWVIMAKAYCGKLDLGMARAMLLHVPRSQRAAVRNFCREVDLQLPP